MGSDFFRSFTQKFTYPFTVKLSKGDYLKGDY